ncbi:HTH_48 domain-containing protein [Trichonephila clavipes]|nr:HTH_48 domain-containing protein [Trichonephila clavipes]
MTRKKVENREESLGYPGTIIVRPSGNERYNYELTAGVVELRLQKLLSLKINGVERQLHACELLCQGTPTEIHRQLCQVNGPNIMSKQIVRCWCRQFSEGRQSVHDEERSGRPSLINIDLVERVRQRVMENRRVTITEWSSEHKI